MSGIKELKNESHENVRRLISLCDTPSPVKEGRDLKRYYMNKYGNYMAGRIATVLLTEFMLMIAILNTGIDRLWRGIPYGETMAYGLIWGVGGMYLVQMLIKIIWRTYDLKKAVEAGKVKKNSCRISFSRYDTEKKATKTCLYVKPRKKNEPLWFFERKSKTIDRVYNIESNINFKEPSGTELIVYIVDDKRHDLFLMVKGRPIRETADKILKEMISTGHYMRKAKWNYFKMTIREKFKKAS